MDILGRFSDEHLKHMDEVAEELFKDSILRSCCDVQYHAVLSKISILVYPRLTKYITKTEYIPFRYKGIDIRLIHAETNGHLNNLFNSITKY